MIKGYGIHHYDDDWYCNGCGSWHRHSTQWCTLCKKRPQAIRVTWGAQKERRAAYNLGLGYRRYENMEKKERTGKYDLVYDLDNKLNKWDIEE
jgi:hypothetical protein